MSLTKVSIQVYNKAFIRLTTHKDKESGESGISTKDLSFARFCNDVVGEDEIPTAGTGDIKDLNWGTELTAQLNGRADILKALKETERKLQSQREALKSRCDYVARIAKVIQDDNDLTDEDYIDMTRGLLDKKGVKADKTKLTNQVGQISGEEREVNWAEREYNGDFPSELQANEVESWSDESMDAYFASKRREILSSILVKVYALHEIPRASESRPLDESEVTVVIYTLRRLRKTPWKANGVRDWTNLGGHSGFEGRKKGNHSWEEEILQRIESDLYNEFDRVLNELRLSKEIDNHQE